MGVNRKYCRCFLLEFYIFCVAAELISGAFWITQCKQQRHRAKGERNLLVFVPGLQRSTLDWPGVGVDARKGGSQAGEWRVPPSAVVRDSCAAVLRIQFELSMPGPRLPEAAGNKALNLWHCHICCALSRAAFKGACHWLPLAGPQLSSFSSSFSCSCSDQFLPRFLPAPSRSTARIVNSLPGCFLPLQLVYSWNSHLAEDLTELSSCRIQAVRSREHFSKWLHKKEVTFGTLVSSI